MAQPVYPFNPFNDNLNCVVTESFKFSGGNTVYFPRATPFFFDGIQLYRNAVINADKTITGTLINAGQQYALANTFDIFTQKYNKNVFSSFVVPDPGNGNYVVRYNTVGGPFVLDDAAYAVLVANILNHDREAFWEDFINVPTEWPSDPHDHPVNMVYNVTDLMVQIRQLLLTKVTDPNQASTLLAAHLLADLAHAHSADKSMVGLSNVDNFPSAAAADIAGNNPNMFVTIGVLKTILTQLVNGTLILK